MSSFGDQAAENWDQLVDRWYPQNMVTGVTTTFTLYRRDVSSATSDLGVPANPWRTIASDLNATIMGMKDETDVHFEVTRQGNKVEDFLELVTSYDDIREGDNVILAFNSRAYHVEASSHHGALQWCAINPAKAQVRGG